jgi:hypothetical protein
MEKYTVAKLKKDLKKLEIAELVEILSELFKNDKKVQKILTARFVGDIYQREMLIYYKEQIDNIFFPKRLISAPSLSIAKKKIAEFKAMGTVEMFLDLELYAIQCGFEFAGSVGWENEKYFIGLCQMFSEFVVESENIQDVEVQADFSRRIFKMMDDITDLGWGVGEAIVDLINDIPWMSVEDEDEDE